jgi:hypothetical protein
LDALATTGPQRKFYATSIDAVGVFADDDGHVKEIAGLAGGGQSGGSKINCRAAEVAAAKKGETHGNGSGSAIGRPSSDDRQ